MCSGSLGAEGFVKFEVPVDYLKRAASDRDADSCSYQHILTSPSPACRGLHGLFFHSRSLNTILISGSGPSAREARLGRSSFIRSGVLLWLIGVSVCGVGRVYI